MLLCLQYLELVVEKKGKERTCVKYMLYLACCEGGKFRLSIMVEISQGRQSYGLL